ncbi:MAG: DUF1838 domain-containing protein [Steroidobacteraceae bacterium]|jgi:hypothetical protein|nr:DUF1838 domain-containing protein [Steroidobacteraceae bacterium]
MQHRDRPASTTRREWLKGTAGTVFAGTALGAVAAADATTTGPLDPSRAADRLRIYRKLRYRTDDGLIWWWLQGPKFGQVGTTLTPLFTLVVGTLMRIRHRADGGFDLTTLEMVFLADVDSGARLAAWRNPYTGETLPVKFDPLGPSTVSYRPDNSRVLPTEIGGARLEASARSSGPLVVGDDVFVRDESTARVFSPGRTAPFEVNDISTYHGNLRELLDPKVTMARASVAFAEVTGWQRWMNMGERPGNLTSRSAGAKVADYGSMPENWRAMLAEVAPRIAADPVAALEGPAARFTR